MDLPIHYPIWFSVISVVMLVAGDHLELKNEQLGLWISAIGGMFFFGAIGAWLTYIEVLGFGL